MLIAHIIRSRAGPSAAWTVAQVLTGDEIKGFKALDALLNGWGAKNETACGRVARELVSHNPRSDCK